MSTGEILIYQNTEGIIKLDVQLEQETDQMATLFRKSKPTVNEHILNIFEEKELN